MVVGQPGGARVGEEPLVLLAVRVQGEPDVVDRDKGTPVWETSTRLAFSSVASLGTPVLVPEATDTAAGAKRDTHRKAYHQGHAGCLLCRPVRLRVHWFGQ
jgi:hypothetical protein